MATPKVTATMDKVGIESAIKSIAGRGAALDKDIQLTGLSVLAHVDKHGEVSLFTKLYKALPKGSRSNALVAWAITFGKVEVNLDKATKKEFPFVCGKGKKTDLKEATLKPWFDFKKPADVSEEFDLDFAFIKFMSSIEAKIKAGKVDVNSPTYTTLMAAKKLADEALTAETGTEEVNA